MKHICLIFMTFLLFQSCKTKQYTLDNYDQRKITFGNGGGFTGQTDTYVLLENGQLFNNKSRIGGEMKPLPSIDKEIAVQIFNNFYTLKMDKSLLNDPGNLTYFVKLESPAGTHSLKWGGTSQRVNANINQYYLNLYSLAQRQKKEIQQAKESQQ